ncbi:MAG: hypothetical protein ACNS62_02535 [Candidatus Cyclobacteriaceae bacterium M3_2C_046]
MNTISNEQRLEVIHKMIAAAKKNYSRNSSFHFLLWGWLIAICSLLHFILIQYTTYDHPYIVWLLTIPGILVSFIYGFRNSKKQVVRSHYDFIYMWIWLAYLIQAVVIQVFGAQIGYHFVSMYMMFGGSAMLLTGIVMDYKPLTYGAIVLYSASVIAFMVAMPFQLLTQFIAVLFGYLLPGYMLKRREEVEKV